MEALLQELGTGNHIEEKPEGEKCFDEIKEVLKKYNCQIICIPQKMYGQTIYVPMIEEKKHP